MCKNNNLRLDIYYVENHEEDITSNREFLIYKISLILTNKDSYCYHNHRILINKSKHTVFNSRVILGIGHI